MAMLGNAVIRAALSDAEIIVRQSVNRGRVQPERCEPARRAGSRRRVLRSAAEMPVPLIDACISEMADRLSRTPEAHACVGLSLAFVSSDVAVAPARYEVHEDGTVDVRRGCSLPSTFTFIAGANTFDSILRGQQSALLALLQGHVHMDGSLTRFRTLLRMLPAVQHAYCATRNHMIEQHARRYEFAF